MMSLMVSVTLGLVLSWVCSDCSDWSAAIMLLLLLLLDVEDGEDVDEREVGREVRGQRCEQGKVTGSLWVATSLKQKKIH